MGEELEEPLEIKQVSGVSKSSRVVITIYKKMKREKIFPSHRLHQLKRTRRRNPFSPASSSSVIFLQAHSLKTSAHLSSIQTYLFSGITVSSCFVTLLKSDNMCQGLPESLFTLQSYIPLQPQDNRKHIKYNLDCLKSHRGTSCHMIRQ